MAGRILPAFFAHERPYRFYVSVGLAQARPNQFLRRLLQRIRHQVQCKGTFVILGYDKYFLSSYVLRMALYDCLHKLDHAESF